MAFVVFALSVVLMIAGLASGFMSLDLLPTGVGLLYALGGAVAVSMALVALALAALIRRVDALTALVQPQPSNIVHAPGETPVAHQAHEVQPIEIEAPAEKAGELPADAFEEPVNENRAGRLPTLGEIEHAIETPEPPPGLIGRYSSGGANYMIFDDGSIEAETGEGTFKFASMGDFKRYLADRKARS